MKFVNSKTIREYALSLFTVEGRLKRLRAKVKALEAERNSLRTFIILKRAENFRIADDEGYLMQVEFQHCEREDVDDEAVRRFFAKYGKEVPMKTSKWTNIKVRYVQEGE